MGAADSKLAFKKGVFRLFEERVTLLSFWTLPESADDVFLLVGSQDIRRVRDEARENLECLIDKIIGRLFSLCDSPQFLTPEAPASQLLNCVRILTRLFPFVFESDELMLWEDQYFWNERGKGISGGRRSNAGHANESKPSEVEDHPSNSSTLHSERISSAPNDHGRRLIKTLLDLLFTSGFTLPTALESRNRVSYVIWYTGIGSSKPIGTSKELDENRTEILRLLLVLFSRSMYISPTAITTTQNRWIDIVVTGSDRQITLAILCSLVNSALKYNPSGWGLPYNHVMFNDQRELLVMLCLQVIVVLLDYQQQSQRNSESAYKNQFRFYLSRLHREQDFLFLTDGMYRILSNPMAASSTYLPGSTKQVKCHIETLMFCWKTLEANKRFRVYLLETNRVLDFVVILLYFSLEHKLDPTHAGLVRMCACMLQTLSKDKTFGHTLNRPFDGHPSLPANVRIQNFHGTYGDYLICSIQHLIATTKRTLRSLYPALISTLSNVSPYIQNISPLASSRLLQLTTSFASPSFLLAEESNHRLLGILLDTVTSILYYQAPHNPHLVYALIQYEPKIQTMARFTLQRGLDDIHKLRYRKDDSSSAAHSSTSTENYMTKSTEGRQRQSRGSQSHHSCHGETTPPPLQPASRRPQLPRRESSTVEETSTSSVPVSGSVSVASMAKLPPAMTATALPDSATLPIPLSPRSINMLSERARGKLPEKSHHHHHPTSTTSSRRPTLTSHGSSSKHERPTTAFDVGQNGFVPTDEWVREWMSTLRFEPLLIMLQCVIPEIESIQAMNDQQVLEYIRTNIIPMLQQVLPESGRPPIFVRKFMWIGSGNGEGEDDLALVWWFQGLLWSQIYVGGCGRLGRQGLGAWYGTGVKLFSIRTITSSTSATTVMAVTDNMSTVAAAAIRAAGSTFATSSLGSGTSSPDTHSFAADAAGVVAASGAGGRGASGQYISSSSRRPSSTSVPTSNSEARTVVSAGSSGQKSSLGMSSKDTLRNS
ncbi:MAG: high-temperature-induced dauer-formation protein-domain-containing protein [Linnemannia gamsii]|nr:MAG: high-temperature-induced dauer-formation protein-domain-containing protein [Linnemannia gamsii]